MYNGRCIIDLPPLPAAGFIPLPHCGGEKAVQQFYMHTLLPRIADGEYRYALHRWFKLYAIEK